MILDSNSLRKTLAIFIGGAISAMTAQSAAFITGNILDWKALVVIAVIGGIKALTLIQTDPIK